jgi:tetratricopeptide (TPR) repeat protein
MFQGSQGNIKKATLIKEKCPIDIDLEKDEISTKKCPFPQDESVKMPKGHGKYTEQDKEKCPYFGFNKSTNNTDPLSTTAPSTTENDPKKKEGKIKKPKGGCPFMPSENKKPPGLGHFTAAFEVPYISQMKYLLSFRGLISKGEEDKTENHEKFENYPMFLKHTLFHNEEKMKKIRSLEISHRFFVYDKFREKGNKNYNKGNYEQSIGLFEHALSCFKWLEFKETPKKEGDEENKDDMDPIESLKPINKALVSIITDENIALHDGDDVTDATEKDMRNSMLLNCYLSLGCCYMNLTHFGAALEAFEEGFKITQGSSQLHFRRSQARSYNKASTLEELLLAKADIEKAIEIKHYEKLFQSEPGILKLLNLHNAQEIYVEHAHFVENAIKDKNSTEQTCISGLISRAKELEYIEDCLIKEGKIPSNQNEESHSVEIANKDEDNMEYDVVKEMVNKYLKVIEFYQETEKKDQVVLARKEIQGVLDIFHQMKFYINLDFTNSQNNEMIQTALQEAQMDAIKPKTIRRLNRLKINKAKELFETGHFNLELFQYAVKDYFKRKEEKEERRREKEKEKELEEAASKPWKQRIFGSIFTVEFGFQISIILLLFMVFWYFNKSNLISPNMFWK